jgi:hypothetical protein
MKCSLWFASEWITDKNEIEERVVTTIEQVALWDEVKRQLKNQLLNFLEVNNNGYVSPCSRNKAFYIIDG